MADLETRPESVFSKIQLKSRKYYPQLFKVHGIHRIDNTVRYNLVEYDPESNLGGVTNVYIKVSKDSQTLTNIHPEERVWDDKFKRSHIIVLNPMEFNKHANVPNAPRPKFLSMIDVDYFQPSNTTFVQQQQPPAPELNAHNNNNNNNDPITIDGKPASITTVQGDGNCMFRAAIKGVEQIGRSIPYNNHKFLREEVVRRNFDQCKADDSFIVMLNASDNRSTNSSFFNCDGYKEYMSTLGTWGGHAELLQIQNVLSEDNIGLRVYERRGNVGSTTINVVLDTDLDPVVRLIRINRNHYNVLKITDSKKKCDIQFIVGPKFRKRLMGVRIVYTWLVDNKPKGYVGRINKYIGSKLQKDGPFAGRRSGSFFELSGVVENDGRITKYDIELRPELYGENVQDGWRFVDENTIFDKCENFISRLK